MKRRKFISALAGLAGVVWASPARAHHRSGHDGGPPWTRDQEEEEEPEPEPELVASGWTQWSSAGRTGRHMTGNTHGHMEKTDG